MQDLPSKRGLAIATVIAIIATLLVNTLSNFFPPGGQNVGEISNTILSGVLITPANYAFVIWGLIYIGLIAYGIYQLQPSQQRNPDHWRRNKLLIVACIAQVIWIFCFTLRFFSLSIVPMLGILVPLLSIYNILGVGKEQPSWQQRWLVQIPLSVYTAWISVATIVNVASALYIMGWGGWGIDAVAWTAILLVVGGLVAGSIAVMFRDTPFVLVFVWAYSAIAIRHTDIPAIWMTAVIVMVLLIVLQLGSLAFTQRN